MKEILDKLVEFYMNVLGICLLGVFTVGPLAMVFWCARRIFYGRD